MNDMLFSILNGINIAFGVIATLFMVYQIAIAAFGLKPAKKCRAPVLSLIHIYPLRSPC